MPLTRLRELLNEADVLISQHAIYISKLERAIKNCEEFAHKTCHECNFGVKWDGMVVPVKGELPEEARALVEEIEKVHCEFHEVSMQIDPKNPQSSDEEKLNRMKELSSLLFQKLLALKRFVKED
jgi:RNA polymerase subunit RPABC4/transcription elongation factor Spt4